MFLGGHLQAIWTTGEAQTKPVGDKGSKIHAGGKGKQLQEQRHHIHSHASLQQNPGSEVFKDGLSRCLHIYTEN